MFYVQHLLGVGHLKRAAVLTEAMGRAGLEVTLVTGGFEVPGLQLNAARVVQLPAVGSADAGFSGLVDARGQAVDQAFQQMRRELLLQTWAQLRPHVLLVELFPFGRRQMRFELLPLLDAVRGAPERPCVVSSVRDVLGGAMHDHAKADWMLDVFERGFDRVLVHGDPSLIPFERSFLHAARLGGRLQYTGYVVEAPRARAGAGVPVDDATDEAEVLVSAGGGAVGMPLLEAAIRARPLTRLAGRAWRVLAGVNALPGDVEHLCALARDTGEGRVIVERHRADFAQRLAHCAVSVSQGGYNTTMEILQARARAVLVPFAAGHETEQTQRARLLADRGCITMLEESSLTPQALAQAIDQAARTPRAALPGVRLDGADATARLVRDWAQEVSW